MFNGKTIGFMALSGVIQNKGTNYGSRTHIRNELYEFKFLMHPVRLAMMKVLLENPLMTSAELRFNLDLTWGEISNHISTLKKQNLISTVDRIIDNSVRQVITVEEYGIQSYNKLSEVLADFFNSPDYDSYIEEVDKLASNKDNEVGIN